MKKLNEFMGDTLTEALTLEEEIVYVTIDPHNKIPLAYNQNKIALQLVRLARSAGLKAVMVGKHVRIKGMKKNVTGVLRATIGKSSMGNATIAEPTNPQIKAMLKKAMSTMAKYDNLSEKSAGPWYVVYDPDKKSERKVLNKFNNFADAMKVIDDKKDIDYVVMPVAKAKKMGIKGA